MSSELSEIEANGMLGSKCSCRYKGPLLSGISIEDKIGVIGTTVPQVWPTE
ncbi:MAG: hypothetical protein V3T40_05600 [Nitrososphaerales archaeon]